MRHEAEAALHGLGASRAVEHDIVEVTPGIVPHPFDIAFAHPYRVLHAIETAGESKAVLASVENRHLSTIEPGKDRDAHPDRPRPRDQGAAAAAHLRACHGMGADGQELHHRRFVQRDAIGLEQVRLRQ